MALSVAGLNGRLWKVNNVSMPESAAVVGMMLFGGIRPDPIMSATASARRCSLLGLSTSTCTATVPAKEHSLTTWMSLSLIARSWKV
ncbi:hypothetical protein [Pseudoxanthomonas winnipegensis]|uniref:hypothetical protein n=1 Tax=Pseudoxanthomonas winnipegensis TaxID=2480810 RepID=UPI00103F8881|nr:hypothetical protein [Pseudoxanthomonas winnipegensis]TBV69767.1 hypothetical protein EYC45_19150 [Pseudoxanthomonas winnipegensis]